MASFVWNTINNFFKIKKKAMENEECVGAIVCKLDRYKDQMRGYIAMLDVDEKCRRKKIGSNLVSLAIKRMIQNNADEASFFFRFSYNFLQV